ncbi:MAG TPA: NAD(P)H-dependent oxidoreductase [Burkholderiaceae bacterium]|nr:NAD(P)H-dependent oxidoreductase [Burkholderiaceae bacterium]
MSEGRPPACGPEAAEVALVVLAHPQPGSFSHAVARTAARTLAAQGHEVRFHDLYAEGFDPVQPVVEAGNDRSCDPLVERHCEDLALASVIVVCHPNWWGQPPAVMKGWIDRVFRLGTAYRYPEGVGFDGEPVGLLRARCAWVFHTSNTPPAREQAVFGDPLARIWRDCVFRLCGVNDVRRRTFGPMASSTEDQRRAWLREVEQGLAAVGPADRPVLSGYLPRSR